MKFKNIIALTLSVLMLLAVAGCSGKTEKDVDINAFYSELEDSYDLSDLMEMDAATLDAFYPGLSDLEPELVIAHMPMMTSVVSELVIVQCKTEADATKASEVLQARVDSQASGGAWYPESVALWGKARIETNGRYVMLAAHSQADAMADSFNALFTK